MKKLPRLDDRVKGESLYAPYPEGEHIWIDQQVDRWDIPTEELCKVCGLVRQRAKLGDEWVYGRYE